jgi:hypothetical protein
MAPAADSVKALMKNVAVDERERRLCTDIRFILKRPGIVAADHHVVRIDEAAIFLRH